MAAPVADLRKEYTLNGLDLTDVLPDPIAQFQTWFTAALAADVLFDIPSIDASVSRR